MFSFFQPQSYGASQSKSRQPHSAVQAGHLIGQNIRVNRGGPDSVEGVLLAIPGDYLVVLSNNFIVYVNGSHVKSITESSRSGGKSGGRSGGRTGGRSGGHKSFNSAPNFHSLLSRLRHKHVQINRGGPEKLDGFLAEISSDNVLLIVERELVRIPIFHIKTVTVSSKGGNQNGKSSNENKGGNNKSGGSKSGSSKSGGSKSGSSKSEGGKSGSSRSGSSKSGGGKSGSSKSGGGKSGGGKSGSGKSGNKNKGGRR